MVKPGAQDLADPARDFAGLHFYPFLAPRKIEAETTKSKNTVVASTF